MKFTGESQLLRQFLLGIYDTLEQFSNEFATDKRRINWIAGHFVSSNNDVSPSQAWFLALLMKNAHVHCIVDPYVNLKSLEYVLPPLCSTHAFIKEVISVFGDKTSSKTARQDFAKCRQGNTSIGDYNARYTSLALYVVQSEEDAVLKYVSGLNPEVRYAAIHIAGWSDAMTVAEKQSLAVQRQKIVDKVSELGGKVKKPTLYQHPNATHQTLPLIPIIKAIPVQQDALTPMEIDAISTRHDKKNPFPAIRLVCIQNTSCFRCFQAFDPKTHMINGERHCPNKNASLSEKLSLISDPKYKDKKKEKTHQIAALLIEEDANFQDSKALEELGEEEKEAVEWLLEDYLTGRSDITYPCRSEVLESIEVNSIRLMADNSYPRRVVVPMTVKSQSLSIQTMVFLDIGSMSSFVNEEFVRRHGLTLKKKEIPMRCEWYDGTVGRDVEWEWDGKIEAVGADGETEAFKIRLNVTSLGRNDVMIGLPSMEGIGCFLKLIKGGSYVMLGKKLLIAATVLE